MIVIGVESVPVLHPQQRLLSNRGSKPEPSSPPQHPPRKPAQRGEPATTPLGG